MLLLKNPDISERTFASDEHIFFSNFKINFPVFLKYSSLDHVGTETTSGQLIHSVQLHMSTDPW